MESTSVVDPREAASGLDISVAVVGSNRAVGKRIASSLASEGLTVDASAPTARGLAAQCPPRRPHIAVLARDGSGAELAADIHLLRERLPGMGIVVVSSAPGGKGVRKALKSGAKGFVFESKLAATLPVTVRAVCAGQLAVPQELIRDVERPTLSFREKQILGMVVLGFQNQEIAAKLHLAETTVKSHLSSTFKKLDVGSRQDAAALVLDHREGLGPGILSMPGAEHPASVEGGG